MSCWSCQAEVAPGGPFCGCGRVQPPPGAFDPFEALGLPRALEPGPVEEAHRRRARLLHPDRFARRSPQEQRLALAWATRLNDARRALQRRRDRAAWLLRLRGRDPLAPGAARDGAFLAEQLALRERLAEGRAAGDGRAPGEIAAQALARLAAIDEELLGLLGPAEPGEEALRAAAACLVRARFLEALAAEAGR
ncbi:MAG: Fe-S protein assembly co-chaperone HscB [Deltaproteobacteria bacterium]|nr:Fe-S protein assembly co-chaperone HscB [Deltaproteobacteria bacterium]